MDNLIKYVIPCEKISLSGDIGLVSLLERSGLVYVALMVQ